MNKSLWVFLFMLLAASAQASPPTPLAYQTSPGNAVTVGTSAPLPVAVYGGTSGYCLTSNGTSSAATFQVCSGGGSGSPGGTSGQIQYNNSGAFGGFTMSGDATTNTATGVLTVTKAAGNFSVGASALFAVNGTTGNVTAGTYNGLGITGGASSNFSVAAGKTLTDSNTLTFTGTDSSSVNFGAGGTVLYSVPATSTISLGTSASATNPQRSGQATTGFYSNVSGGVQLACGANTELNCSSVGISIGTTAVAANPLDVNGSAAFGAYAGTASGAANGIIVSGSVGIGTATPSTALDVRGVISINENAFASYPSADTTVGASIAIGPSVMASMPASAAYLNTGLGYQVLSAAGMTTAAVQNTGIGYQSLSQVTSGHQNTSMGYLSGNGVKSSSGNTFIGWQAGVNDDFGNNVAIGIDADEFTGGNDVAVGPFALYQGSGGNNVAIGGTACGATGSNSMSTTVCLGPNVGSTTVKTGSGNILLGTSSSTEVAIGSASNEINIGGLIFYDTVSLAAPAVSACGTGTPAVDVNGNNRSGTLTAGGGVLASCTLTFAGGGYKIWNHCRVTFHNSVLAGAGYSYTKAVITVTATSLTSAVFDYDCDGY